MAFTLADMVSMQAQTRPDATAISCDATNTSWADLERRSTRLAGALQLTGLVPGDRVGLLMKNTPVFYEALFGCNKAEAVAVGLNWRLSRRELAEIVADAAPRVIIADQEHAPLLEGVFADTAQTRLMVLGDSYESWLASDGGSFAPGPGSPESLALILYSSGTTGKAKGISLSNRNFSFIRDMATELFRMRSESVYLLGSPLFHIGGAATGSALMTLGGRTVLLRDADPDAILEIIERERVTHTFFVPAVIQRLVEAQKTVRRDLSSLELLAYGAAPMSETLLRSAIDTLGCGFLGCYGMTETAGTVTALFPEEHEAQGAGAKRLQSVGRALPWAEIKIVNTSTGAAAAPGEFGEIWVRSDANTPGYFNNPAATAEAIGADGWLRTGDGAVSDADGYIYLKDRIKDMIISGGENVYPIEVENVLAAHPQIAEVAVIGVPDERWGETVRAVVVPRPGANPDPQEIIQFARAQLAHYKCPTSVSLIDDLPRTATGKVLKTSLRKLDPAPGP